MPTAHTHAIVAALSVLLLTHPITQAEVLTYGFSGSITSHENYTDLAIEEAFPLGTNWEFTFTFDPSVPITHETSFPDIGRARYNIDEATSGRSFDANFTFRDQSYEQVAGTYGHEGVFGLEDDAVFSNGNPPEDFYVIQAHHFPGVNGIDIFGMVVVLRGASDAHAEVSLAMQPDLSRYPVAAFLIWSEDFFVPLEQGYGIYGSVDRYFVVPEPTTLTLLALSGLALLRRSNRA